MESEPPLFTSSRRWPKSPGMTKIEMALAEGETRGLLSGGEMEDVAAEAEKLLALDVRKVVFHLETGSVYGTAIAFPQLARCSNYNKVYVALWIRSWLALALNLFLQLSLVVFVGEATQIMNPLGGMMHLCDFGANLDTCKGPDEVVDGCVGPGGTQFAPPRLYGYTQWAVQKFTKQALLDVLPDKEDTINAMVDPGEYGIENFRCRLVCLFLFTLSVMHEIVTCLRMGLLLWSVPSSGESQMSWITHKQDRMFGKVVAKYRVGGMPLYWKTIVFLVVFLPKLALCHYVLLEGTLLLMDTSGILDGVLGALSMGFVLSIDEMLNDAMTSGAAASIMKKLELSLEEEELAQEKAEENPKGILQLEAQRALRANSYAEHADRGIINLFPVPLVIFGAKWDVLATDADPEKRKTLCRALRHFALANGAHLVLTSLKDKTSMNAMHSILRQLLFAVPPKGSLEQLDHSKPICVPAGKDSVSAIGLPASGQANERAWKEYVQHLFPDPSPSSKGGKKSEADQVMEELFKYPESSIDGMVEQRVEELQQYRRQVQRNQRLASEGIEGNKVSAVSVAA